MKANIAQLAREAGLPYRTVFAYFKGERRPQDVADAQRLANVTGRGTDSETLAWLSKDPALIAPMVEAWASRQ
jgi:AcrR family transcriptional regulator